MSAPDPAKTDAKSDPKNDPKHDPLIGQIIDGRYRISRQIAVGGMGVVYEAKHAKIGRSVAIKVLHREMAGDSEVVGRFLNEARAMGTIGHPNIVACTDFGELPGSLPYLVLEYLEGRTLGEEIATTGPMAIPRALRIAVQVASALEAAHSRGVIHRDLTSGNVFLTKSEGDWESVKVLDFGISKFLTATDASPKTRRGFTMGTPEFMAPEQVTSPDIVDARADVYALGVVLYHMLAGKTPFGSVAVQTLFLQVVNELPPHIERDDIPPEVLALLDKALAKDPAERFADMRSMGAELELLAPPPVLSGNYSGRVEVGGAPRPATGSRPILRINPTTTSRQVAPRSGVYAAATRTSLVQMAADKAGGGEAAAAPRSTRRPLVLGGIGFAAALVVVGLLIGRSHKTEAPAGLVARVTPEPGIRPPVGPVKLEVTSATPSARVTFRARVHQLPFSEAVDADTKPEVVEVTAPGREGRRFWLTIDHPMKLSIDLSPGRGIIEATTEEALVALGQRAAEALPPGAAAPAESPGGKHGAHQSNLRLKGGVAALPGVVASAAAAPRKGGLGSSSPGAASGSASGPSGGASAPGSNEAPAPPPTATKPAAPDPVAAAAPPPVEAPAPPPPPPVAAKPQPAPSHPASTSAPAPAVVKPVAPTIDAAKAQEVFAQHGVEVQRCHQRAKIDNSDIHGKVNMKVMISTTGQVIATTIESSNLHSASLEACIATAVKSWTFPAAVGGTASINHAFVLR